MHIQAYVLELIWDHWGPGIRLGVLTNETQLSVKWMSHCDMSQTCTG